LRFSSTGFCTVFPEGRLYLGIAANYLLYFSNYLLGFIIIPQSPEGFTEDYPALHIPGHFRKSCFRQIPGELIKTAIQEIAGLLGKLIFACSIRVFHKSGSSGKGIRLNAEPGVQFLVPEKSGVTMSAIRPFRR